MKNSISEFKNVLLSGMVLTDLGGNIRLYNINEEVYVFMISSSLWNSEGLSFIGGFSLKEKLYILSLSTSVMWRRITFSESLELFAKYRILNPMQLTVKIEDRKVKKYIATKGLYTKLYLCLDIVL